MTNRRKVYLEEALGCPGWPDCECGLRWLTLQHVVETWEIARPNKEETEQVAILCWAMLGCISYHCDDPYMRLRAKQQLASDVWRLKFGLEDIEQKRRRLAQQ